MKEEARQIQNFATLKHHGDNENVMRIVKDESGNELGFELTGTLTTFGVGNENGYVFEKDSYDDFIDNYYEKNGYNVPLFLLHDDFNPLALCGYVKSMTKTDTGVEMVAFVDRAAYLYNNIKNFVKSGVYQAFSNLGGARGYWDDSDDGPDGGLYHIKKFELMSVSLVCTPGDATTKFKAMNTKFNGFNKKEEKEEEKHEGWEW